jgi:hypothetical protein
MTNGMQQIGIKMFKRELIDIFNQLTVCLQAAIEARDRAKSPSTKHKYRKLAASIEISLKSLESAINLIGE